MKSLIRTVLWSVVGMAVARSLGFFIHAYYLFIDPLDAFYLESKMVHLAWRVHHGLELYPDYAKAEHEANFFGPFYFFLVGVIGWSNQASVESLYRIGRGVTVLSGLIAAVLVACYSRRTSLMVGRFVAAMLSFGTAPMIHFGAMCRPDLLADTLGFAGWVVASETKRRWHTAMAAVLLTTAILTKQTAGLYLIAAFFGILLAGRSRTAIYLGISTLTLLAIAVSLTSLLIEPRFLSSLLAESETPIDFNNWLYFLVQLGNRAPELILLNLLGCGVWLFRQPKQISIAVLSLVMVVGTVVLARKMGSDLNYFLPLRLIAGVSIAHFWANLYQSSPRPRNLIAAFSLLILLVPGLLDVTQYADRARSKHDFYQTDRGQKILDTYRKAFALARDPNQTLLTDVGVIAIRQGEQARFVDPWLFRMLAASGRIDLRQLVHSVERGEYTWIISSADLNTPSSLWNPFVFPPPVIQASWGRYRNDFGLRDPVFGLGIHGYHYLGSTNSRLIRVDTFELNHEHQDLSSPLGLETP